MKYRIAKMEDVRAVLAMRDEVKKRIILDGLPIWLDGYPSDELIITDIKKGYGRVIVEENVLAYASCYPSIEDYPEDTFQKKNLLSFGRIMVCTAYLGKHCASLLVSEMIKEAKNQFYSGMGILVDACNQRAIHLYQKYGFVKEGSRQFPYAYLDIYSLSF